jgi:hypothetical protein
MADEAHWASLQVQGTALGFCIGRIGPAGRISSDANTAHSREATEVAAGKNPQDTEQTQFKP